MDISHSGSSTAGGSASLMCSATAVTIIPNNPLPLDVSSLTLEWLFGPNSNSLPSGVTATPTIMGNDNSYTSTLQLSPLNQSYAGNYTCRFGGTPRLSASVTVVINGIW